MLCSTEGVWVRTWYTLTQYPLGTGISLKSAPSPEMEQVTAGQQMVPSLVREMY